MFIPFQGQRRQSPRGKSKLWQEPPPADRAEWTWLAKEALLRSCHEQVTSGEFYKGALTKLGWQKALASFEEKMGHHYILSQVKNQFRQLKKDYIFIVDLLHHQTGAGLHPITGTLEQDNEWWVAKNVEKKGKAMAYRFVDLRPYRDLGPAVFDGNLATGEFSIAPSRLSNTFHAAMEDFENSDPDKDEGSGESGGGQPIEEHPVGHVSEISRSGGSSGKRKRVVMATNSLVTGCRRRLAVTEMTGGSMQTTGQGNGQHVEAENYIFPSIARCMAKIRDLEETNLELHTHAVFLLENPVNRQFLFGFSSNAARDAWLIASKAAKRGN